MKRSRVKGTGSLFKRGRVWYFSFVRNGQEYRYSAKTDVKEIAAEKLKLKLREVDGLGMLKSNYTIDDLMDAVAIDYRNNNRRSVKDVGERWTGHLKPFFGGLLAHCLTTDHLEKYKAQRRKEGAADATVNRELAQLRRAYHLGKQATPPKVAVIPLFPLHKERNTRKVFLQDADYDKLVAACSKHGIWLRTIFEVGYQFGWRRGEVMQLCVRNVDLSARTLRLDPGTTKNDDPRVAVMPQKLFLLVQECTAGKKPDDFLFTRDGEPITDYDLRVAWDAVTQEVCLPQLLFHDLRRTAAMNMDRRGISQRVIMQIMGHKTDSMFKRYRITNHGDLQHAAKLMEQPVQLTVHTDEDAPAVRPN